MPRTPDSAKPLRYADQAKLAELIRLHATVHNTREGPLVQYSGGWNDGRIAGELSTAIGRRVSITGVARFRVENFGQLASKPMAAPARGQAMTHVLYRRIAAMGTRIEELERLVAQIGPRVGIEVPRHIAQAERIDDDTETAGATAQSDTDGEVGVHAAGTATLARPTVRSRGR